MTRTGSVLVMVMCFLSCLHTREVKERPDTEAAEAQKPEKKEKKESQQSKRVGRKSSEVKRPAYAGRPELSSDPAGLMQPEGPMKIQRRLAALGFYSGESTGELDEKTSAALRRFQEASGLAKTGAPDRATVKQLGLDPNEVWRANYGD